MSDNTRREAASTDPPHPARHPHPPQHFPAPRGGDWPDARTAEVLLSGSGSCTPPTEPADRLVRLLAAARDGRAPLDPAREAAALAAFRTAAAGRRAARGRARGGLLAALRTAFALRRPRMMAAAVVSALALGGVAVGVAAATRSFTPGEGATAPNDTRPPAAVATDGSTSVPTAAPGPRTAGPAGPAVHTGGDGHMAGSGRSGRGDGGTSGGFGRAGAYGFGQGHGCGQFGRGDDKAGYTAGGGNAVGAPGKTGRTPKGDKAAKADKAAKGETADKGRAGSGPRHTRPGRSPASRAPGR